MALASRLLLVFLPARPVGAWELFSSFNQGYTHYRAAGLNQVLVLLEATTQQQGFNNYEGSLFDGHHRKCLLRDWHKGPWWLGLVTRRAPWWCSMRSSPTPPTVPGCNLARRESGVMGAGGEKFLASHHLMVVTEIVAL